MSYRPNIFRPRVRTPAKLLHALLVEAARQVDLYDRIRLAHPKEFLDYFANSNIDLKNKTIDHFFKSWAVRNILDRGRADYPDPTFEAMRARALVASDAVPGFDVFALISEAGSHFGMAPIYKTIWEAQSWLDTIYSFSTGPNPEPILELVGIECLEADMAVLKIYIALAEHIGEPQLLALLDGPSASVSIR